MGEFASLPAGGLPASPRKPPTRPSYDVTSVDAHVWASALNTPRAERVCARSETLGGGAGEAGARGAGGPP
jgi:hypothetical protein